MVIKKQKVQARRIEPVLPFYLTTNETFDPRKYRLIRNSNDIQGFTAGWRIEMTSLWMLLWHSGHIRRFHSNVMLMARNEGADVERQPPNDRSKLFPEFFNCQIMWINGTDNREYRSIFFCCEAPYSIPSFYLASIGKVYPSEYIYACILWKRPMNSTSG
jgi:hypothetical protein